MTDHEDPYKKVTELYDRLAKYGRYATLAPHDKGGRKAEYVAAVFDATLLPRLAENSPCERILDFGCGTGIFTKQAAIHADEVVGIDVSTGMLLQAAEVCRGLSNVLLLPTDGQRIPLPDRSVNWVIAREVLCYVPDASLQDILVEIRRVLKLGGGFLWLEQVSNHPYWQHHHLAPHLVKRSSEAIRAAAAQAGLKMESEKVVRTPRFPWIYPIWLGLIPRSQIQRLARIEVTIHLRLPHRPYRWWNSLFVFRNPINE